MASFAASNAESPFSSIHRKMFSWTTIASSITIPTASTNPNIVMLFRVNPIAFMNVNVPMIETGIERLARIIVRQSRRKSRIVSPTKIAPRIRCFWTSWIDPSMKTD